MESCCKTCKLATKEIEFRIEFNPQNDEANCEDRNNLLIDPAPD